MHGNYSFNQYQKTQFTTADPGRLVLMMYDGAIQFIEQARNRMNQKDMAGKGLFIGKAQNIVSELNSSLDPKRGGDLATSLETLYLYINNQLSLANVKNSSDHLENALRIVKELRAGWEGIVNKPHPEVSAPREAPAAARVRAAL